MSRDDFDGEFVDGWRRFVQERVQPSLPEPEVPWVEAAPFVDQPNESESESESESEVLARLVAVEEYLKNCWHDPRFGLRFAVGFVQALQADLGSVPLLEDVRPVPYL